MMWQNKIFDSEFEALTGESKLAMRTMRRAIIKSIIHKYEVEDFGETPRNVYMRQEFHEAMENWLGEMPKINPWLAHALPEYCERFGAMTLNVMDALIQILTQPGVEWDALLVVERLAEICEALGDEHPQEIELILEMMPDLIQQKPQLIKTQYAQPIRAYLKDHRETFDIVEADEFIQGVLKEIPD